MVPKLTRPVKISGQQSTDEVVLERLDGSFCFVDAMIRGFNELPLASLSFQEGFDGTCRLVVCHVELWLVALVLEFVEHFFECCYGSGIFEVWARFGKHDISVIIIHDKIRLHALKRCDWERASHVSVKVPIFASPSAAQQKTLLALWLSSMTVELLMFVGAVSAKLSSLGTSSSSFILGLVVRTLAHCFFSDGFWKWLAMALGISPHLLVSSNMGFLPTVWCLLPQQLFGLVG